MFAKEYNCHPDILSTAYANFLISELLMDSDSIVCVCVCVRENDDSLFHARRVIFGMLIALPITILYYVLLGV